LSIDIRRFSLTSSLIQLKT